jgi:hypothetical protein
VDDLPDQTPPEVTIEPADNGFVVRHHQRSSKKDEPGRTVRRVASSTEEALGHAATALGGGKAKSSRKKSHRDGQLGAASAGAGDSSTSPAAHSMHASGRSRARRRRPRIGGRR